MNTKTKGDILADKIEEYIKANSPHFPMMFGELGEALAGYRRPLPVLTPAQIADGWLEWHGGECPVWGGSTPTVMYRDKETYSPVARNVRWRHIGLDGDIIAYRPDPYEALKKAHSEGKVIQVLWSCNMPDEWEEIENPDWTMQPDRYRIKPAPVMVPLGPEDVKCGDEIRHIHQHLPVRSIISKDAEQVVAGGRVNSDYRYEHLQKYFEIDRNDGRGFVRCEKEAK